MSAYYNEHDKNAAAWLREIIKAGLIADGEVDERSIEDVAPADLTGFVQHHFFAGIGGWPCALRLAGWPDDRPVWTGSCPCQPFSAAGKGGGFADERHLWPAFHWLIGQCRPDVVFGEQVEGPAGRAWLDLVFSDLEGSGYACGAAVFPAAGVGAPHGRHRTYWMADAGHVARRNAGELRAARCEDERATPGEGRDGVDRYASHRRPASGVAEPHKRQRRRRAVDVPSLFDWQDGGWPEDHGEPAGRGGIGVMADADFEVQSGRGVFGPGEGASEGSGSARERLERFCTTDSGWPSPADAPWRDADWLFCRDGKWRPVEPGTFPLAYGLPARVGRLRGYGNAIVPQVAARFIEAARESMK